MNACGELVSFCVTLMAFFIPNYVTIASVCIVQICLVFIPLFVLSEPRTRVVYMHYSSRLLAFLALAIFSIKSFYLAVDSESSDQYGIYYDSADDIAIWRSILFETTLLLSCGLMAFGTQSIKHEVTTALQLKTKMTTYIFNRHFCHLRSLFKYVFAVLSIVEACFAPAVIAMPVLYALLVLVIASVTIFESDRNRDSDFSKDRDSDYKRVTLTEGSLIGWAITR